MLNTDHFMLLAGVPDPWDEEIRQAQVRDPRFNLARMQVNQLDRGRRSARMNETSYGWNVAYASALDDHATLYGNLQDFQMGKDCSIEAALRFGIQWANSAPDCREFFVARRDIKDVDPKDL